MLPSPPHGAQFDYLSSSCPWVSALSGSVFVPFLFFSFLFLSSVNYSQLEDEQKKLSSAPEDTSSWGELFQSETVAG